MTFKDDDDYETIRPLSDWVRPSARGPMSGPAIRELADAISDPEAFRGAPVATREDAVRQTVAGHVAAQDRAGASVAVKEQPSAALGQAQAGQTSVEGSRATGVDESLSAAPASGETGRGQNESDQTGPVLSTAAGSASDGNDELDDFLLEIDTDDERASSIPAYRDAFHDGAEPAEPKPAAEDEAGQKISQQPAAAPSEPDREQEAAAGAELAETSPEGAVRAEFDAAQAGTDAVETGDAVTLADPEMAGESAIAQADGEEQGGAGRAAPSPVSLSSPAQASNPEAGVEDQAGTGLQADAGDQAGAGGEVSTRVEAGAQLPLRSEETKTGLRDNLEFGDDPFDMFDDDDDPVTQPGTAASSADPSGGAGAMGSGEGQAPGRASGDIAKPNGGAAAAAEDPFELGDDDFDLGDDDLDRDISSVLAEQGLLDGRLHGGRNDGIEEPATTRAPVTTMKPPVGTGLSSAVAEPAVTEAGKTEALAPQGAGTETLGVEIDGIDAPAGQAADAEGRVQSGQEDADPEAKRAPGRRADGTGRRRMPIPGRLLPRGRFMRTAAVIVGLILAGGSVVMWKASQDPLFTIDLAGNFGNWMPHGVVSGPKGGEKPDAPDGSIPPAGMPSLEMPAPVLVTEEDGSDPASDPSAADPGGTDIAQNEAPDGGPTGDPALPPGAGDIRSGIDSIAAGIDGDEERPRTVTGLSGDRDSGELSASGAISGSEAESLKQEIAALKEQMSGLETSLRASQQEAMSSFDKRMDRAEQSAAAFGAILTRFASVEARLEGVEARGMTAQREVEKMGGLHDDVKSINDRLGELSSDLWLIARYGGGVGASLQTVPALDKAAEAGVPLPERKPSAGPVNDAMGRTSPGKAAAPSKANEKGNAKKAAGAASGRFVADPGFRAGRYGKGDWIDGYGAVIDVRAVQGGEFLVTENGTLFARK